MGISVVRQAGSNTIRIAEGVRAAVRDLNESMEGIQLEISSDDAVFIQGSVREVITTLLISIAVVIGTIRLSLARCASHWYLLSPYLSPCWAHWPPAGRSGFPSISDLLALVLAAGLIVDDAIVVLESVQRKRRGAGLVMLRWWAPGAYSLRLLRPRLCWSLCLFPLPFYRHCRAFISGIWPGAGGRSGDLFFRRAESCAGRHVSPRHNLTTRQAGEPMGRSAGGALPSFSERVLNIPRRTFFVFVVAGGAAAALTRLWIRNSCQGRSRQDLHFGKGPDGVGLNYTERQADRMENILMPLWTGARS